MSDPTHPAVPAGRARPTAVTISSYLLLLVALLLAINAVVELATLSTVLGVYRDAYDGTEMAGLESFVAGSAIVGAVVQLLLGVGLVVLALLNNRGRNASRIITWVVGGLGVCCTGANLASPVLSGLGPRQGGDLPDAAELQSRLTEALPGWVGPLTTITSLLTLLALLVALILLALPASNRFFRGAKPGPGLPMPGSVYPGYPGHPGYPPGGGSPSPQYNPPGVQQPESPGDQSGNRPDVGPERPDGPPGPSKP